VLDAPYTERYVRCGERTGANHPLLLDWNSAAVSRRQRSFSPMTVSYMAIRFSVGTLATTLWMGLKM